jgi:hypothetical protein
VGCKRAKSIAGILLSAALFILVGGAWSLPAEVQSRPDRETILVIGEAGIVRENVALAKERAVAQALRKGLEGYLLRRLGSRKAAIGFQRLIREVLPQAKEKVENYNILAAERFGNDFKVLVRVRINPRIVEEQLRRAGVIEVRQGPPVKVLFLVAERSGGQTVYWWKTPEAQPGLLPTELALLGVLQNKGLRPINRNLSLPEVEYPADLTAQRLSREAVRKWGKLVAADVVIHGESRIVPGREVSVNLQALDVRQGTESCRVRGTEEVLVKESKAEQPMESLVRLLDRLSAECFPDLLRAAAGPQSRETTLEVTLAGLERFKQVKLFRDFLKDAVQGVKSVRQSRIRPGSVSFEVQYQGDSREFVDRVLNHNRPPFGLELEEMEGGKIRFVAL